MDILLILLALPVLAVAGYLGLLAAMSRRSVPPEGNRETRFDIIVPAHNERGSIAETVANLLGLEYPSDRFRVIVVADNCTDDTASLARAAGARVLVRDDPTRRGKGYAIELACRTSLDEAFAGAVVIIDADSVASRNLLSAFSARFAAGADVVQAEYGVRNPDSSWRTRLMVIAFALFHTLRSIARDRLRLSCGLRGNGMGFSSTLLRRTPPNAYSLVEDVEYGIVLGLAGTRVLYVAEACVLGEMPSTGAAARTQRARWEHGRWALVRAHLPALLDRWRKGGGRVPFDLAVDLIVPPLTTVITIACAGTVIAAGACLRGAAGPLALVPWILALAALASYVGRGLVLSGAGSRALVDLAWAPVYAFWKLTSTWRASNAPGEWVRTARTTEKDAH